jgi:hypothetical protein
MGTKAQISWDFKLKDLYAIKPGTKKVKTKAVKTATSPETNETAVKSKSTIAIQYFCKITIQASFDLTLFTHPQTTQPK